MNTMQGFWMVVGALEPVYRHETLMSAHIEASRLARLHPGQEFTVLKSVATVKTNYETWISHTYKDAAGNEVPF